MSSGRLEHILRGDVISLIIVIILLVVFTLLSPNYSFLYVENIENILSMGPELGLIILGVSVLMIAREFDLSVGSELQFCMFIFVTLLYAGVNDWASFFVTLGVGAILGLINAMITIKGRIPSFITTLGTMLLWRGLVLLLTLGYQKPLVGVSDSLKNALISSIFGVPVQIVWFAGVALVLGFILHRHKFGNWIYATGDNEAAARAMGVNTTLTKTICFMIVGTLCGLASIMQVLRVGSFFSRAGDGWELKAIAAAVLGGTSLKGGIGSIPGAVLGAFAIILIENAITTLRIDYFWTYIVEGAIIVLYTLATTGVQRLRGMRFS